MMIYFLLDLFLGLDFHYASFAKNGILIIGRSQILYVFV